MNEHGAPPTLWYRLKWWLYHVCWAYCVHCIYPEDDPDLWIATEVKEAEKMRGVIASMDAAIDRYAQHETHCKLMDDSSAECKCTCGLWDAQGLWRQLL